MSMHLFSATDPDGDPTARGYGRDLDTLHGLVLEMGGQAMGQIRRAIAALLDHDAGQAFLVLDREPRIAGLAREADEAALRTLTGHRPAAADPRLPLILSRIASDLARAGDGAVRVARLVVALRAADPVSTPCPETRLEALRGFHEQVRDRFERGLRAVAHFDTTLALGVLNDEPGLQHAFRVAWDDLGALGDAPRQSCIVGLLTGAQVLETVGGYASRIAEQVLQTALDEDVRYRNRAYLLAEIQRHEPGTRNPAFAT